MSLKFVSHGAIGDNFALNQVMAWRPTGDKPLHATLLIQFTDAYKRQREEMN